MELVPIIQILSSSEVVKWLLKCPLCHFGVKGKIGLATTLVFMRKGQAGVFIIRMIRLNSSSALQALLWSIVFEKWSYRIEWGFKPRAPEVLTSYYSSSPGSTATITTNVFRVKRWHKYENKTSFFKNNNNDNKKQEQEAKNETKRNKWNDTMRKSNAENHFNDPSHQEAKKKRVRGTSFVSVACSRRSDGGERAKN